MTEHRPRKRFGQHFLRDRHYIDAIMQAVDPAPGDRMVEIGPGEGALTAPLLERLDRLHAVELDRDLAAALRARYPPDRLVLYQADALAFDFAALGPGLRVVGNLPYNISTPLLFHVAATAETLRDCHFMLQREVVERMVAAPDTPAYGRLSVMLQYRFRMEKLFTVPPGAFRPPPQVDSAVVRMLPFEVLPCPAAEAKTFAHVVAAAFSQRRKMLRTALRDLIGPDELQSLGIEPTLRGETLPVCDFVRIADRIATARPNPAK